MSAALRRVLVTNSLLPLQTFIGHNSLTHTRSHDHTKSESWELRVGGCFASPQQAKEAMSRRITNPKAEAAGLSSGAEEVAKAGVDEYAREAELCDL